jgi:hypothetical protein
MSYYRTPGMICTTAVGSSLRTGMCDRCALIYVQPLLRFEGCHVINYAYAPGMIVIPVYFFHVDYALHVNNWTVHM